MIVDPLNSLFLVFNGRSIDDDEAVGCALSNMFEHEAALFFLRQFFFLDTASGRIIDTLAVKELISGNSSISEIYYEAIMDSISTYLAPLLPVVRLASLKEVFRAPLLICFDFIIVFVSVLYCLLLVACRF